MLSEAKHLDDISRTYAVGALSLRQSGTSTVRVGRFVRSPSAKNDNHMIITYHAAAGKTRLSDAEWLNCVSPNIIEETVIRHDKTVRCFPLVSMT